MDISLRLQQVFNYLEEGYVTADIGCDHALLPLHLISSNKVKLVYAMDNKEEPLSQAKHNIDIAGVQKQVVPLLSEGLDKLPLEVEQISLAGLGGSTIVSILNKDLKKLEQIKFMVLQPNNNVAGLRLFLNEHSFSIINETLVKENHIIYEVLKVKQGQQELTKSEVIFGPCLLKNKSELFYEKWSVYSSYLEKILERIPQQYSKKRLELEKELLMIRRELD